MDRLIARDIALAAGLALALGCAWTIGDWAQLSALRLPDTDDAMRLQQVRDWLAGQRFADLTQHRLGAAPGASMHWSRLPDLGPALVIEIVTPIADRHAAEVAAAIVWPTALLGLALALVGALARRLGTSASTAMLVAAVAYPATALFLPGRLDHHGLQAVLLLLIAHGCIAAAALRGGVLAGLAAAASVAIGMEGVPLLAAAGLACGWAWVRGKDGARLAGLGVGLASGLVLTGLALATEDWTRDACDGFTRTVARGAIVASIAPIALSAIGRAATAPWLRLTAGLVVGTVTTAVVDAIAGSCASPYAAVDPLVATLWLANVAEAQPLLAADARTAIAYAGPVVAGLLATLWCAARRPGGGWLVLAAMQAAAVAVSLVQMRALPLAPLLAAPALAAMIGAARARGGVRIVGAWLASAGILYPIAAQAALPRASSGETIAAWPDCATRTNLARLASLPTGRVMAPMDLSAHLLAHAPHHVVAAPYHRNNEGNAAMYRFFRSDPAPSRRIADAWRIGYVALCRASFAEPGLADAAPTSLMGRLRDGTPPDWLRPMASDPDLLVLKVPPS